MRPLLCLASWAFTCLFVASAQSTPIVYDTPLPTAFPRFGTLVDFDDQPAFAPVIATHYASLGLAAVESIEPLPFGEFLYYASPFGGNYIGTGAFGERDPGTDPADTDPFGFDGTIRFHFATLQSAVGVGIAETPGAGLPVLRAYDASMNLLEELIAPLGSNAVVYAGFSRYADIAYLEVSGDGFALDNLQFSVPEPGTVPLIIAAVSAWLGSRRRSRNSFSVSSLSFATMIGARRQSRRWGSGARADSSPCR